MDLCQKTICNKLLIYQNARLATLDYRLSIFCNKNNFTHLLGILENDSRTIFSKSSRDSEKKTSRSTD